MIERGVCMFCYNCGQEMQDGWKVCPVCGASAANRDKTDELASPIPQQSIQQQIQQQKNYNLYAEYERIKDSKSCEVLTAIAAIVFVMSNLVTIFISFYLGLLGVIIATVIAIIGDNHKTKKKNLERKILSQDGNKYCPKCKSPNIKLITTNQKNQYRCPDCGFICNMPRMIK